MIYKNIFIVAFSFFFLGSLTSCQAQKRNSKTSISPTAGEQILQTAEQRQAMAKDSGFEGLEFRSIGPSVMSGRVTDIEVDPADATHFYVAYASGGLWETKNNGTTFEPLFDNEAVMSIGDIAVNWQSGDIWIGTGENNSSRSSYSGVGMYLSEDNGKTWQWRGLPDTQHIGKVICHPSDANTIYVGALGALYSANEDRGAYISKDKGKTWQKTLFVNDNAGVVDLEIDPSNPDHLLCSVWERTRRAWNFQGSGSGSGIYESMDGGITWELISGGTSGFPQNEGTGRIGLGFGKDANGLFLYAMHDNQNRREATTLTDGRSLSGAEGPVIKRVDFKEMTWKSFLELDDERLETFLRDNGFDEAHTAESLKKDVKGGIYKPLDLYEYLTDANQELFDTPVIGAELYSYDFSTQKWSKTHEGFLDDVVFSYGYYFGTIAVHPEDREQVYIAGVPLLKSEDGGANFEAIVENNVHADHHVIWVDPNRAGHLINGNDGGINISYDDGKSYVKCNSPSVGQFYTVAVDNAEPYNVYGGLQDNGVWYGPNYHEENLGWHQNGEYAYKSIMGGDGMQVAIDTRDNNIVYTGYQFGHYYRINKTSGEQHYFHPKHKLGERPLRWNWQTPIHLSIHNQDILYMGSNKFHRSLDQGETWKTTPKDLTRGGKKGNVPYGSLTSIHESPIDFGHVVVGSDDGLVHITNDGGSSWKNISGPWPSDLWVTHVQYSAHQRGRIWVTLNGYRNDHFKAYVFRSENDGETWQDLSANLPAEAVNVVIEDTENEDLVFVGTDHGLYASLDMGRTWKLMQNGLPAVAVHDLAIQAREHDLVVGTHGRSFYIAPIGDLAQISEIDSLHVFELPKIKHSERWGESWSVWFEPSEPEWTIPAYTPNSGDVDISIKHDSLGVLHSFQPEEVFKGLNYWDYDMAISGESAKKLDANAEARKNGKYYLPAGAYLLQINVGFEELEVEFLVGE